LHGSRQAVRFWLLLQLEASRVAHYFNRMTQAFPTSADAKALARVQHAGQVDKAGAPYAEHLERVVAAAERRAREAESLRLALNVDEVAQAAWLHDIIEDTPTTAEGLRRAGFAESVIEMVELLTKPKQRATYEERISTIIDSANLGAILIKLSDNEDNADPARPLPSDSHLPARYAASMKRLRAAAEALGYRET
jgi:(p)ppGpp synthase/HD superfamily hydrolase